MPGSGFDDGASLKGLRANGLWGSEDGLRPSAFVYMLKIGGFTCYLNPWTLDPKP